MKINKREFIPVTLTFETEEEFSCFWDSIENAMMLQRAAGMTFEDPFYKILVDISNLFTTCI